MYLIDTNIFLELFLDQENADSCEKLLNKIIKGELKAVTTRFTVHAVEGTLTEEPEVTERFLETLNSSIGIEVAETELREERQIAQRSTNHSLDFDDMLQHFVASRESVDAIISLDSDFDETELERVEPKEVIGS